jgi:hypothetical protein
MGPGQYGFSILTPAAAEGPGLLLLAASKCVSPFQGGTSINPPLCGATETSDISVAHLALRHGALSSGALGRDLSRKSPRSSQMNLVM